ncbi:MAG: PhzF family phenazine biosynthesis protein, partial [Gemmataceae bacterium]
MPSLPAIFHVNAFCGSDAAGNPGAVCLLDSERTFGWMQSIAAQMKRSETGFVAPSAGGKFSLRWFSPITEVPICGHVTLAAAHVLWNEARLVAEDHITFETASGPLLAHRHDGEMSIALPSNQCFDIAPPAWLCKALDAAPSRVL